MKPVPAMSQRRFFVTLVGHPCHQRRSLLATRRLFLVLFCFLLGLQASSCLQFPFQKSFLLVDRLGRKQPLFPPSFGTSTLTRRGGANGNDNAATDETLAPPTPLNPSTSPQNPKERKQFLRELLAEALGTGLIVWWGTGAVLSAVVAGQLMDLWSIAAVWTLAVTLAIAATASISGAHLNPAMTFAFAVWRQFPKRKVLPYMLAQLVGGLVASGLNYILYAAKIAAFEATHGIVRSSVDETAMATAKCFGEYFLAPVTISQAFLAEALGTAVLAFCVFALTHPKNDTTINKVFIPPLIGATVGALICVLAPLTQAGFNPARDFSPRIIAYFAGWRGVAFRQAWLYVVAPLVGAPIGAWVADSLLYSSSAKKD